MIAIQTKYLGPTNTRGSRIKAWTSSGFSVTIPYPHELSYEAVHFKAVKALVTKHKLDWDLSDVRFGGTEHGYVFCFASSVVEDIKELPNAAQHLQRLANCVKTHCLAAGHSKAANNERRANELRAELKSKGISVPSDEQLLKVGVFNGEGSY